MGSVHIAAGAAEENGIELMTALTQKNVLHASHDIIFGMEINRGDDGTSPETRLCRQRVPVTFRHTHAFTSSSPHFASGFLTAQSEGEMDHRNGFITLFRSYLLLGVGLHVP